jgi:hypothetical protein
MENFTVKQVAEAARMLGEIRAAVGRGELDAKPSTAAYLAGAVGALGCVGIGESDLLTA